MNVRCASTDIILLLTLGCNGEARKASPRADAAGASMGSSVDATSGLPGSVTPPIPTRLEPNADCVHPGVAAQCQDGFCLVPAGCFIMGAPRDELGAGRFSDVQVQVTLSQAFWVQRTEVTNEQWDAMGWGAPRRNVQVGAATCRDPNCPVTNVSFFDALFYSNALSEAAGLESCYLLGDCRGSVGFDLQCDSVRLTRDSAYECEGFRLPMEAEWEYAVRAGTKTAFYSGEAVGTQFGECVEEPALDLAAWYCRNSGEQAHPVAEKSANGWGLHDMHGNVWEWCRDFYHAPLPGGTDPDLSDRPGVQNGDGTYSRVRRGGAWIEAEWACRSACRLRYEPHRNSDHIGFRVVVEERR
jgi:sulfatase modifying factor 1